MTYYIEGEVKCHLAESAFLAVGSKCCYISDHYSNVEQGHEVDFDLFSGLILFQKVKLAHDNI